MGLPVSGSGCFGRHFVGAAEQLIANGGPLGDAHLAVLGIAKRRASNHLTTGWFIAPRLVRETSDGMRTDECVAG